MQHCFGHDGECEWRTPQGLDFVRKIGRKERWEFIFAVCGGGMRVCRRALEVIHRGVASFGRGGVEDFALKVFVSIK